MSLVSKYENIETYISSTVLYYLVNSFCDVFFPVLQVSIMIYLQEKNRKMNMFKLSSYYRVIALFVGS